jgi:hypothetical protein
MSHVPLLVPLTAETVACRTCYTDPSTFIGGKSVLGDWAPPRGWAGLPGTTTDLVVVSLNPGTALPGELFEYASHGLIPETHSTGVNSEQIIAVWAYGLRQFRSPRRGQNWVFHRKAVALAHSLLCLLDGHYVEKDSLWSRVWFTDVFKCSTGRESGPSISLPAERACRRHLERELSLLRPRLVVALGRRCSQALSRAGLPHVSFRHPSRGCSPWHADQHDKAFIAGASALGCEVPIDFRNLCKRAHDEAFTVEA